MKASSRHASIPTSRILAVILLPCILLAAFFLYRICLAPLNEGISIGGVEVGGLTALQAKKALEAALEESLLQENLPVYLPYETITLSPADCDFKLQMDRLMGDARRADAHTDISLLSYLEADTVYIRNKLEAYADRYDSELKEPLWYLEGNEPELSTALFPPDMPGQTLTITTGTPEIKLNCDAILTEILHTASEAVPLCRNHLYSVNPEVIPAKLPQPVDAAAITHEFSTEPINDSIDRENYTLLTGSYGVSLDADLLSDMLRQAKYGETIRIPLQYVAPEVIGQDAYFQDILGAYETRHTNDANRNANLQIQCDTLNGLILQPGEVFSMNGVLGERTEERGYKPAPAYSGNRLVNSPGGGVCQGTTTLYNCVLLADLEVVFRACHGVKVGYVPLGLDAAINFLTTDFQFRNNFHFPIQLRAWMEDEHIKMQILGIDEKDYYIKMETGSGEDEYAYYARSYKCKYDKKTDELISREIEAFSTYYKSIG